MKLIISRETCCFSISVSTLTKPKKRKKVYAFLEKHRQTSSCSNEEQKRREVPSTDCSTNLENVVSLSLRIPTGNGGIKGKNEIARSIKHLSLGSVAGVIFVNYAQKFRFVTYDRELCAVIDTSKIRNPIK